MTLLNDSQCIAMFTVGCKINCLLHLLSHFCPFLCMGLENNVLTL